MALKKFLGLLLAVFIIFSPGLTKDKKTTPYSFDGKAAWTYIKDLSTDEMGGRRSGQPSGVWGEEYIASKFREWGLEPAGDGGTYFQNFTIEHRHIEEGVKFEIVTEKTRRDFYYGEDWRVQRYSGSGHFTAEIVFVGYGIHAPDKEFDEYTGLDVEGKVVMFATGSPQKLAKKLGDAADTKNKIEAAQKLGARAIIVFRPAPSQSRFYGISMEKELYDPDFVILSIEDNVTDFIFKDLKTETRYLFREIDEKGKPQSFETGVKAFISLNSYFDEKRPTRNVLAKIMGSDKTLKDEYVIIGGHMDHLGISPLGDVYNGANDNASGTAVAMEIARVMKLNKAKPKRTVIFAGWAGEEQGLLGSRYYCDHPPYPIEKTIAYINMDMVGHGSGNVLFRGEYYSPEVWKLLEEKIPKEILDYAKPGRGGPGGSDHTPFLGKGVPAYAVMTEGYHFKYHRPGDDVDLIKPEILKKVGDLVYASVETLASEPGDLILPMRRETYYLKYQDLTNFKFELLGHVIEKHGDAKDSHVDLQMAVVEEKEGLAGDELRVDIINTLFDMTEEMKKFKGLALYLPSGSVSMNSRQGRTTVMLGLKGINSFRDNPKWARVLAEGLHFAVADDLSFLFGEGGLTEEGKTFLKEVNSSGLLLLVKGLDTAQTKILLEESRKPVVFLEKELPDREILELIKEKEYALGLILGADEEPAAYVRKLDEAKEAIGTSCLMIVNENCLWGTAGKEQMLKVISEMLKEEEKYERGDFSNLFSSTLLRVLRMARGGGAQSSSSY